MNPEKFKSVTLNLKTYKKVIEMSEKLLPIKMSMAKTVEFIIDHYFEKCKNNFKKY